MRSMALVSAGGGCVWRGLQQRADFGQVLQRGELRGGAAFDVAAVGQHLAADLLRQEAQRPVQEPGMLRQRDGGGDQPLQRGQRAGVQLLRRQCGGQAARVGHQPRHQPLAEHVVGGGGEEVVVPEPGRDAGAHYVGPVRDRIGRRRVDPLGNQGAGAQPRRIGAQRAQVAQPGRSCARQCAARLGRRAVVPAAGLQDADGAAEFQLALQQPGAAAGIAGPGIAHRQGRGVGHRG